MSRGDIRVGFGKRIVGWKYRKVLQQLREKDRELENYIKKCIRLYTHPDSVWMHDHEIVALTKYLQSHDQLKYMSVERKWRSKSSSSSSSSSRYRSAQECIRTANQQSSSSSTQPTDGADGELIAAFAKFVLKRK